MDYLKCNFSNSNNDTMGDVIIGDIIVPRVEKFGYLSSIIQNKGDINEYIVHCIRLGWQKWKKASGVLCDKKTPVKVKGKFYQMVVRLGLLYGSECSLVKKTHIKKMMAADVRMVRWMCGHTRLDRIKNEVITKTVGLHQLTEDGRGETQIVPSH